MESNHTQRKKKKEKWNTSPVYSLIVFSLLAFCMLPAAIEEPLFRREIFAANLIFICLNGYQFLESLNIPKKK